MSADAWRVCPQCKRKHEQELEKVEERVDNSYGRVPAEQYKLMLEAFEQMQKKELDETLREDYEIHTDEDGNFYMKYSCYCSACQFSHEEKVEKQILK